MKKSTRGFTIVELLIVVVVIAILAAISIVAYTNITARANDSARRNDIDSIKKALSLYYADNNSFPTTAPNPGSSTWEISYDSGFLSSLSSYTGGQTWKMPGQTSSLGYWYHSMVAGSYGCPTSSGAYYILWVRGMQTQPAGNTVIEGNSVLCPSQTLFTGSNLTNGTYYVYYGFS